MIIVKGKFIGEFKRISDSHMVVSFVVQMGGWDGPKKKSINEPYTFQINILDKNLVEKIHESLKDEKKRSIIMHSKPVIFGDLVQRETGNEINVRSQEGIHFGEFCYNMDLVRTTRDLECKYYESGAMSAFGSCAYDIYDPDAEKQRKSYFLNIKAFGGLGEIIAEKVLKGQQTFLGGYIELNRYKSTVGNIATGFSWNIDSMKFVGGSSQKSNINIGLDDDAEQPEAKNNNLTAEDLIGDDECPF